MDNRHNISVRLYNDASLSECLHEGMVPDVSSALKSVGAREGLIVIVDEDNGFVFYEGLSPLSLMPVAMRHVYYWSQKFGFPWSKKLTSYLQSVPWFKVAGAFKNEDSYCAIIQRSFHPTWFREDTYEVNPESFETKRNIWAVFTAIGHKEYYSRQTSCLFFQNSNMSFCAGDLSYEVAHHPDRIFISICKFGVISSISYEFNDKDEIVCRTGPDTQPRYLQDAVSPEIQEFLESQLKNYF